MNDIVAPMFLLTGIALSGAYALVSMALLSCRTCPAVVRPDDNLEDNQRLYRTRSPC
jgi:hypothetical protein